MIGLPGPEHFIFIPGILLVGFTLGFLLGGRTERMKLARKQERARQ